MVLDLIAAYCAVASIERTVANSCRRKRLNSAATVLGTTGEQGRLGCLVAFVVRHLFLMRGPTAAIAILNRLSIGISIPSTFGALLCWFFPVLNLFCPYQVVREIWWRSTRWPLTRPESPRRRTWFFGVANEDDSAWNGIVSYCFSPHESWPQYYTYFRIVFLSSFAICSTPSSPFFSSCKSRQWQVARHRRLQQAKVESAQRPLA